MTIAHPSPSSGRAWWRYRQTRDIAKRAARAEREPARGVVLNGFAALALLLAGCNDAHPLYGPDTPRNGRDQPVDPVYGIPLPGTPLGNGGG